MSNLYEHLSIQELEKLVADQKKGFATNTDQFIGTPEPTPPLIGQVDKKKPWLANLVPNIRDQVRDTANAMMSPVDTGKKMLMAEQGKQKILRHGGGALASGAEDVQLGQQSLEGPIRSIENFKERPFDAITNTAGMASPFLGTAQAGSFMSKLGRVAENVGDPTTAIAKGAVQGTRMLGRGADKFSQSMLGATTQAGPIATKEILSSRGNKADRQAVDATFSKRESGADLAREIQDKFLQPAKDINYDTRLGAILDGEPGKRMVSTKAIKKTAQGSVRHEGLEFTERPATIETKTSPLVDHHGRAITEDIITKPKGTRVSDPFSNTSSGVQSSLQKILDLPDRVPATTLRMAHKRIDALGDGPGELNQVANGVAEVIRDALADVIPELSELNAEYHKVKTFERQAKGTIKPLEQARNPDKNITTDIESSIQDRMRNPTTADLEMFDEFQRVTGLHLKSKAAGLLFSEANPGSGGIFIGRNLIPAQGLMGAVGAGGTAGMLGADPLFAGMAAIAGASVFSPRAVGATLKKLGYAREAIIKTDAFLGKVAGIAQDMGMNQQSVTVAQVLRRFTEEEEQKSPNVLQRLNGVR